MATPALNARQRIARNDLAQSRLGYQPKSTVKPKPQPKPQYPATELLTSFQSPKVAGASSQTPAFGINPVTLAKDVVQGGFRSGASVALSATNIVTNQPGRELAIDPSAPEAEKRIQR